MEMTFDQYIVNPMGIKNSVFSNKEMYRNLYMDKLDKILVREVGKVSYRLYYDAKTDNYYIYVKVPSEVVPKFYYDTIIQFYPIDPSFKTRDSIKGYYVKFYSNDPSFVFTFAHSFIKNDLFIKDLIPKMSKDAIKKVSEVRNPRNEVGYVKSIYFAYLIIKRYGLFNKIVFNNESDRYDKKILLDQVTHADVKVQDRINAGEEIANKKKIEKQKEKNQQQSQSRNISRIPKENNNAMNITKTIKTVGTVKRTKRISKLKRN